MAQLGRSDRFYANPVLRDEEWNRATQPAWLLTLSIVAIVGIAFYYGFYGSGPQRAIGWAIGALAIVVYFGLSGLRRIRARRRLRQIHGQPS